MELNKNNKKIFVLTFCMLSTLSLILAPMLIFVLDKEPFNKLSILTLLMKYTKLITYLVLLAFELISVIVASLVFINNKWYKSEVVKVTDDIYIPVATGQNQHGSAKFIDKKNYDYVFDYAEISLFDNKQLYEKSINIQNYIKNNADKIDELIENSDL